LAGYAEVMPSDIELLARLGLALVLGGAVGAERELADQPAGLRTHILLAIGACLFTLVSAYGFSNGVDPTRIAAQIVSGVGFLGAGAIIRQGISVRGVTTAASIWSTAALGVAVGAGQYILGIGATVLILATLVGLRVVRNLLRRVSVTQGEVVVRTVQAFDLRALLDIAHDEGVSVRGLEHERHRDGDRVTLMIKTARGVAVEHFCQRLLELDEVREVDWES
jgi:putative Mg2+ transporter-C (MgtC) family protein